MFTERIFLFFCGFLLFSLTSGGRVEGKARDHQRGECWPQGQDLGAGCSWPPLSRKARAFWGDVLPVDPKLEHSMGHKISPAPRSRSSRRANPKAMQQGEPCSKHWAVTLALPRKQRMSHNNSSPCWGADAKLSQSLDNDQGPFDLQSCTRLSCNEAILASKVSAARLACLQGEVAAALFSF